MARIQILELPTIERPDGTEETPFVLVIDQYEYPRYVLGPDQEAPVPVWEGVAEKIGARGVLVFEETVDIPANEVPVDPDGYPLKIRVEGDFEQFREQVQDEIRTAQQQVRQGIEDAKERYGAAPTSPETNRQCAYGGGPSCACTADSSAGTPA